MQCTAVDIPSPCTKRMCLPRSNRETMFNRSRYDSGAFLEDAKQQCLGLRVLEGNAWRISMVVPRVCVQFLGPCSGGSWFAEKRIDSRKGIARHARTISDTQTELLSDLERGVF